MTARDRKFKWRPESQKISNMTNQALLPIMEKALKMGLSADTFYYIVSVELHDLVNYYFSEMKEKKEMEEEMENEKEEV